MTTANSNMIPIDGDLLLSVLKSHNIRPQDAAKEMGYNTLFITQSCRRGTLNSAAIKFLEVLYGINYEEYAPQDYPEGEETAPEEEVVTEVVESIPVPIPLTKDDIYRAVMDANQAPIEIFLHKLAAMCQKGDRNTRGPLYDTFQASVFYGIQGVWLNQKDNIETMLANAIRSALRTNGR